MAQTVYGALADYLDPPAPASRPELASPLTLAAHLDPGYQVRAHLRVIGDELAALERGDFDRLLLNTPPQVGKSVTAVEWGAFWWLCLHPTARIIIGCYGDVLALKRGRNIRKLVIRYGAAYGLSIVRGSASMKDWELNTGGGVFSVGVGAGVTGQPGDVLFIDDPTRSRKDADSLIARDAVYDAYSADWSSRLAPGAPIMLIQTPWHPDDLRARVVAQEGDRATGGRWRVVIMAAICEVGPEADPLGRQVGEPIPHPKIADGDAVACLRHWERTRGGVSARDWRALWQCDPKAPEGALVSWELLRERRCFEPGRTPCDPIRTRVGIAVDPSGGGRDTAGLIAGYLSEDVRLHFIDDRSGVMPTEDWARVSCEMAADHGADFFVVERNYGGDMAQLVIRTAWEDCRRREPERFSIFCPRVIEVTARREKVLRAEPVAGQWATGRMVTTKYMPEFESEWATWTVGTKSPGRIDASVYLALEALPVPSMGDPDNAGAGLLAETDLLAGLWGRG